MHRCRSCGAPIIWAISVYGRRQPIDPEPTEDGNLILEERTDREQHNVVHVGKPDPEQLFDDYEGRRHKAHHATCPQGREWRKA